MIRKHLESRFARLMLDLPKGAKRAFAGSAHTSDGYTLDPEWQLILRMHALARPALHTLTPQEARVEYRHLVQSPQRQLPSLAHVEEMNVGGAAGSLRARFYRPNVSDPKSPLLLWFHAGGFTIGDLDTTDPAARFLAAKSRVSVLSVQYRKAPEAPFPAPVEDAVAAWQWAYEHAEDVLYADKNRIGVGGASAGANLSAIVCQRMLDTDGPVPKFLLMLYSMMEHGISTPSRQSLGEGYGLDTLLIKWFMENYLVSLTAEQRSACKDNPQISPLAYGRLGEMPPMVVATAGFDPLRDESRLYVDAVNRAGGQAKYRCFGNQIHGFAQYASAIPSAAAAMEILATDASAYLF